MTGAKSRRGEGADVAEGWRLSLLGPLEARCGGVVVPIRSASQRVVLAVLALAGGEPVTVDRLTECLWDEQPPSSARNTVQNFILRLRRSLRAGEEPCPLVSTPAGYRLTVDAEAVDVHGFESLLRSARSQVAAGGVRSAAGLMDEALGMWRGDPLTDVASEVLHREVVPGLAEARVAAQEQRFDLNLRLGRHQEVATDLIAHTTRYPLRERGWAQLMLALYRCGRTAEALGTYQKAGQVLAEELGVDPGPDLRRLHQALLTEDPDLALADPAATTAADPAPAGRPAPAVVPRQLPAVTGQFFGRARELDRLSARLAAAAGSASMAVSVIGGTAGIGKSKLAVHWGHLHADRFPDGQLYVNLRGFDPAGAPLSPGSAARGFLNALGVPTPRIPADPDERYALYRSELAGRRMLVVLDNARDAEQVRPLLPGAPGPVVLVTSRGQLGSLVALDGALPLNLDLLPADEARGLLVRRLGRCRAGERAEVDELVALCAGLPLALVILAARAALRPDRPLAEFVHELRDARRRLDGLSVGEGAADIRTAFSWSYRLLSPAAARVFRLLGLHPDPDIGVPAAAGLAGLEPAGARGALAELARAGLLVERATGEYSLHDLLHAYAADLAVAHETRADREDALRRLADHRKHAAGLAAYRPSSAAAANRPEPPDPRAWLQLDHPELIAVRPAGPDNVVSARPVRIRR
jgi:DNA-binding SARP family transcriptional activator